MQAACKSKANDVRAAPMRDCTSQAVDGSQRSGVAVVTMRRSMSDGSIPVFSMTASEARSPMSVAVICLGAMRRSRIPVRSRIQASDVSTIWARSEFARTWSGR